MKTRKGVLIVTDNDAKMIRSKHWLVSRGITYKTFYLPIDQTEKQPVIMATMTLIDRLLYRLTFGKTSTERVSCYM